MEKTIETRVGYMSVAILTNQIKDYIHAFTVNGKYEGELKYIDLAVQYAGFLKN